MSLIYRLRHASFFRRRFSTILSPNSNSPLSAKEKTRAALTLLKSEDNPYRIVEICKAASLTPEFHLDRIAFSVAISKLSESNNFEVIREFLEELKSRPDLQSERFVTHAMVLYGQANMIDHAISTFKQCDELGIARSVKMLNSLIFACILAKNYKEVNRIFLEFPKIYGIVPNLDTYNWVIKAFAESRSTSSAYSVLAEMDRKGVKPNEITFAHLLSGFYAEERFEDAGKVTNMMDKYGLRPGLTAYNARILSLCKLKRSAEAKSLLDGMLSRGMKPKSPTYCHLIHGFCKEGNLDEAKKLFKKMVNSGLKPDSNCYFTLVYFLCQANDFETALTFSLESMEKNWVPNFSTMKSLVDGLVSISKVAEARDLVAQIKTKFTVNADRWNEIEASLPQ
ncbi:hypothetical protein FNV43_RR07797 [Rhamnella rubrinervis]|uniref:Pentatricopeptide repeat-containing protein n=1 Tax=Rhamnella rubrinervis TaxID=2594499 RepID=A0A8K0MMH7_9ROSA|nr:hypothetical protein FNV43_RR07797 [Rhamnella rubrinervis]